MKTIEDLSEAQKQFIKDHALELFDATMLEPNDSVMDILMSSCSCCDARRKFLEQLFKETA